MKIFLSIAILFMTAKNVYAYIDTSVATYIVQGIAAICVMLGVFFSVFKHKIINLFRKVRKKINDRTRR